MDILARPHEGYQSRLSQRQSAAALLERRHHRIGYLRLGLGALFLYTAYLAVFAQTLSPYVLGAVFLVFIATGIWHSRILRQLERANRAVQFYRRGLARLAGDFSKPVSDGRRFSDPHHIYSGDIDLFGPESLFSRLCHARTREGEQTLAHWLLTPGGPSEAPRRLEAAEELSGQLEIREELALLGSDLAAALHPQALRAWAADTSTLPRFLPLLLYAAGLLALAGIIVGFSTGIWGLLGLSILISGIITYTQRRRLEHTLQTTKEAAADLRVLEGALRILENAKFQSELLRSTQQRIHSTGLLASQRIAKLAHLAEWIDSLNNDFFLAIDRFFLFSLHFVRASDNWRAQHGSLVDPWLTALGEFEALCSFAAWRYENPDTVAPEWADGGPFFEGRSIRHPLIPRDRAVPNDVFLDPSHQLILVSGSNMSGKSTLLRTVGTQTVLAHAGAHVPAESLRLSHLQLAASIRTQDSLQEGASRFYAELQRLKAVVDASRTQPPLLFLLDELLSGTNSHDRRIGAQGIIHTLLEEGAVGLVTTHDLALAAIADDAGNHAVNVHFEDQIVDGRISFDYRMKPGIVRTSNALALMRAVGLEIPERLPQTPQPPSF